VRVSGAGRLADFRERLRWLMVRDADAEDYTEHHAEGMLEFRFQPKQGIPFPAFAQASGDFPELRVEAHWDHDGARGHALIENGRVVMEDDTTPDTPGVEVRMQEDGRLEIAMVLKKQHGSYSGYATSSDRQTYFHFENEALTLVEPAAASPDLEEVAFRLVDDWIWFDEEDEPVERLRYAGYGYPVRGANLKSEKLALLRRQEGARWSTLDAEAARVREALVAKWLKS